MWVAGVALLLAPALSLLPAKAPAQEAGREQLTLADWPAEGAAARGRRVYENYCLGCHGEEGAGDGPAARYLDPIPRSFPERREGSACA